MTSQEFVIWLKGFSEACNDFHPTPKQWDRLKEVLNEVEDYNDYGDLDKEVDDWYGQSQSSKPPLSGSFPISTSGTLSAINYITPSGSTGNITHTVIWNDKMGAWHYTNYPDGFGYYHVPENKKELLND